MGKPRREDLVPTAPLREHVEEWIHDHRGAWPPVTARSLADKAGVSHILMEGLMSGERETISVTVADRLLMQTNGFLSVMYPVAV